MNKSKTKIRILLADDHHLVRSGIHQLLESAVDMEVIAEAGDGEEAQALIQEHRPDVGVLDIQMPKATGIEVTRASKLIDETLNNQPKDVDHESATKLAKKKYEVLMKRNLEPKELRNKLSTYLFSKGFEYDLIKEVCDSLIKANYEEF